MNVVGQIISIRRLICEVQFTGERPGTKELLALVDHPGVYLEVAAYTDRYTARCINLSSSPKVFRGAKVMRTKSTLAMPQTSAVLGRALNAFGQPIDGGEPIKADSYRSIYQKPPPISKLGSKPELQETGIKVIDFFTPFVKGRKIGIIGGAGVGKTVLTMELIHNVVHGTKNLAMFVGIGERIREGHELFETLKERNLLAQTCIVLGQMHDPPAMRALAGISAATIAEYLRDVEKRDTLVFIDNIYRFVQANNELSTTLGKMPSEGNYQATLFSDLRRLQDRLISNDNASITSVQAIYIPADDLSDPAVQEIAQQLDSTIVLSRKIAEMGIRPAVDLIHTSSSLLTPEIVGDRHYVLATQVQAIMQKYDSLKNIIAIIGESELSPDERSDYAKATKIIEFFSQNMFVTEQYTGKKGEYFKLEDTLQGVEEILI
jgi:F-type H+-transporting ATPase subunit beta